MKSLLAPELLWQVKQRKGRNGHKERPDLNLLVDEHIGRRFLD